MLPVVGIKYHSIYILCLPSTQGYGYLRLQEDGAEAPPSDAFGFTFVETLLVSIVGHQRSALRCAGAEHGSYGLNKNDK